MRQHVTTSRSCQSRECVKVCTQPEWPQAGSLGQVQHGALAVMNVALGCVPRRNISPERAIAPDCVTRQIDCAPSRLPTHIGRVHPGGRCSRRRRSNQLALGFQIVAFQAGTPGYKSPAIGMCQSSCHRGRK